MSDRQIEGYAAALFDVARAEGAVERLSDELFHFSRAVEASPELRSALTDPGQAADAKSRVVEELLAGKTHPVTLRLISLVLDAGLARDLTRVVDGFLAKAAAEGGGSVAEVRVASPLSEEQRARLQEALTAVKGRQVDVRVIIDPAVLGGVVTTIGDEVIDGSVRHRLEQLRSSLMAG